MCRLCITCHLLHMLVQMLTDTQAHTVFAHDATYDATYVYACGNTHMQFKHQCKHAYKLTFHVALHWLIQSKAPHIRLTLLTRSGPAIYISVDLYNIILYIRMFIHMYPHMRNTSHMQVGGQNYLALQWRLFQRLISKLWKLALLSMQRKTGRLRINLIVQYTKERK